MKTSKDDENLAKSEIANQQSTARRDAPLLNILFNVLIPITLLHQLSKRFGDQGPLIALLSALAFPISYGLYDYLKNKQKNFISIFGMTSVLFTGGFALLHLQGMWFAVKEAAFPGVMALGVAISAHSKKPLVGTLFCNPQILNVDIIYAALAAKNRNRDFLDLQKRSTLMLAGSFIISSILNFIIALRVFTPIDSNLTSAAQAEVLNAQIAKMTGLGFSVIALPMMVLTGVVLYFFLKKITTLTELTMDQIIKS